MAGMQGALDLNLIYYIHSVLPVIIALNRRDWNIIITGSSSPASLRMKLETFSGYVKPYFKEEKMPS